MNWLGNLLIIVGISFDVYAAMEVRGALGYEQKAETVQDMVG